MKIRCEYCDSVYEDAEFCPHCLAPRPGKVQAAVKPEPETPEPAVQEAQQEPEPEPEQEPAVQEEAQTQPAVEPIQPQYGQSARTGGISGMSIVAVILALFVGPVGAIVGIVDLVRNKLDGRSHFLSYAAIVIGFVLPLLEILD